MAGGAPLLVWAMFGDRARGRRRCPRCWYDMSGATLLKCPECGREGCEVHDTEEKTWRDLDFFQHRAYLTARVPRVICPEHRVKQVEVPWARERSGFTLLFEALVMALVKEMPVKAVAGLIGETDMRVWR